MAKTCNICKSSDVNDLELGEFLECNDVHVHYFCLLLTTSLQQNGEDDEGLLGFLIKDIKKCVSGLKKNICYICSKPYANIECAQSKCLRKFHTHCGLNRCLNTFSGKFNSFCGKHHHIPSKDGHKKNESCLICYDLMNDFNPVTSIQPVCCKSGWMHRKCLAHYAKNSGYFCKCPLCNNDDKFRGFIVNRGIFIPDRDAAWELEPNAYSELLERPRTCQAANCSAHHRDLRNIRNKMKACTACGSYIAHIKCWIANSPHTVKNFICDTCAIINRHNEVETEVKANSTSDIINCNVDDDTENDIEDNCIQHLKRNKNQIICLESDSDSDSDEVKVLRGRKIKLNRSKDFNDDSDGRRLLDTSKFNSSLEFSLISSSKSFNQKDREYQNHDNNSCNVNRRIRRSISKNDCSSTNLSDDSWNTTNDFDNSCLNQVRRRCGRPAKIKKSTECDRNSQIRLSLDSSNLSTSSELSSIESISSTSDNRTRTNRIRRKRKRLTMKEIDTNSEFSDNSDWNNSTRVKRYRSSRVNKSNGEAADPSTNGLGILSDISNNNRNTSNSVVSSLKRTLRERNAGDSTRLSKTSKRHKEEADGLCQTKIDMYFQKIAYS